MRCLLQQQRHDDTGIRLRTHVDFDYHRGRIKNLTLVRITAKIVRTSKHHLHWKIPMYHQVLLTQTILGFPLDPAEQQIAWSQLVE